MQRVNFRLFTFALIIILLASCKSGLKENTILGKLPSISQNYVEKIEKIKEEQKKNTDFNKAFELAKKQELLEEEANNQIKEYMQNKSQKFVLPFNQLFDKESFIIKEVVVSEARFNDIKIEARVEIQLDYPYEYFAYMRFIDEENQAVDGWAVLMSPRNNTKGKEVVLSGYYQKINKLLKASKVEFRSRDEYNSSR